MEISFYGYTYIFACILQNIHHLIKHLAYICICQHLKINNKTPDFVSKDFHVDIGMKTIDAYFCNFLIFL